MSLIFTPCLADLTGNTTRILLLLLYATDEPRVGDVSELIRENPTDKETL